MTESGSSPLYYRVTGAPGKPLVVFLHGFLGSADDWNEILPAFETSFRCVAVDLPGHGRSYRASGGVPCTFLDAATALIEVVDAIDAPSFSLVGYSMGGRLALYAASIYAMRVDRLVLESASPGLRTGHEREERKARDEQLARQLESQPLEAFVREWYEQPLFATLARNPERREALIARRLHNAPQGLAASLRGMGTGVQAPLWNELAANTIPALLVAGADDSKFVALGQEMERTCAAASLNVMPGAGHCVHYEIPSAYTKVVKAFLEGSEE
ncbi:MAG: 2-succinyl-6-hydroxy-2,4-cyclohexadiene-1-carboxylate synthase [Candidatus Hydrogenedentes bacterium]|nr:2-succinyl-6-hydroxy-2,4-cyclohexadiene-1-carboxylate synthase [Candidatus Hydrogenedentota bacterium]